MSTNERTIVVSSGNPVKIEAARQGFRRMFPHLVFKTVPVSVSSDVADQPLSD
jgi:non-canonical (house-cleaning) NTP pyrophosphatase